MKLHKFHHNKQPFQNGDLIYALSKSIILNFKLF